MSLSAQLVRSGYRHAQTVTRKHARSFSFASVVLPGARRRAAFALYSFCRRLDDLVDLGDQARLQERLSAARATISQLYAGLPGLASHPSEPPAGARLVPWPEDELAALGDAIERFGIPEQPLQDLISGMEMDLVKTRYATFAELELYCHRVAGTVGLMMAPVLGYRDERALGPAAELGKALQLTNILRDVAEDLARGRIYLPADELNAFGVSEDQLLAGRVDDRFVALMRFQVARARAQYERGAIGVPFLTGFGAQRMVRLMGALYAGILGAIERQGYDVFRARAHVPLASKLSTLGRVLMAPSSVLPVPVAAPSLPLAPSFEVLRELASARAAP